MTAVVGFKVYKRKIHVYREANELDRPTYPKDERWVYCWSTNAYLTCKAAVAAANAEHPTVKFKANFAL
jgi:hypothetical protein